LFLVVSQKNFKIIYVKSTRVGSSTEEIGVFLEEIRKLEAMVNLSRPKQAI